MCDSPGKLGVPLRVVACKVILLDRYPLPDCSLGEVASKPQNLTQLFLVEPRLGRFDQVLVFLFLRGLAVALPLPTLGVQVNYVLIAHHQSALS